MTAGGDCLSIRAAAFETGGFMQYGQNRRARFAPCALIYCSMMADQGCE